MNTILLHKCFFAEILLLSKLIYILLFVMPTLVHTVLFLSFTTCGLQATTSVQEFLDLMGSLLLATGPNYGWWVSVLMLRDPNESLSSPLKGIRAKGAWQAMEAIMPWEDESSFAYVWGFEEVRLSSVRIIQ